MANQCVISKVTPMKPTHSIKNVMDAMLCGVGALADMPTGGTVIGDFAAWMVGPMFNRDRCEDGSL